MKKKFIAALLLIMSLSSLSVYGTEFEMTENWDIASREKVSGTLAVGHLDPVVEVTYKEILERVPDQVRLDRGYVQDEWYYSKAGVKWNVAFGELLLEKVGASEELRENYYRIYKELTDSKVAGELISVKDTYGVKNVVEKFWPVLWKYGINRPADLRYLGILLYEDREIIEAEGRESLLERDPYPYNVGEYTRENLLLSATTLVGRVRYVWGGGHKGTAQIEGVNPLWRPIAESYGNEEGEPGFNKSVVPGRSWSPRFGDFKSGDVTLHSGDRSIKSLDKYLSLYKEVLELQDIQDRMESVVGEGVDFKKGVRAQRLDGLDCSGFTSWAYKQVDPDREYEGTANQWIEKNRFRKLAYGTELLPGDIIAWDTHIVMVVGEYQKGSGTYIILEAAPNMVKFGVAFYNSGVEEVQGVQEYVRELNKRVGGIPEVEEVRAYSLRGLRSRVQFGRSKKEFDVIGEDIADWEAPKIVEKLIERLPEYMISE